MKRTRISGTGTYILLASLCLISIACKRNEERLPYYNTPSFEAEWDLNKVSDLHYIPAFRFRDQHNAWISDEDLKGKITLVNFIFTRCGGICPDMTRNLRTVQDTFAGSSDVQFFSYSVKPWEDSIPRLKEFAAYSGIRENNWHLLTGAKAEIYALARKGYFAEEDAGYNKDSTAFLHTENVVLIDGKKRIRGLYKGTLPLDMQHIIADIRILRKEED